MEMEGERALLLYPSGLDFVAAFFGCLYAGVTAVPAYPPRRNRNMARIDAIANDAEAKIALTTFEVLERVQTMIADTPALQRIRWRATDQWDDEQADQWRRPDVHGDTLAFLQYTSGSTGTPKGVMLTHSNLMHNSAMITYAFEHSRSGSGCFWLPLYHDMGLIGGILQPLYMGRPNTLLSPTHFLQKPVRWLQAISQSGSTISGGPNFAYDLCAEKVTPEQKRTLDLSRWSLAFNGAEPVRAETIDRFSKAFAECGFRREAFYPCYGLAEATLIVTGGYKQVAAGDPRVRCACARKARGRPRRSPIGAGARSSWAAAATCSTRTIVIADPDTSVEPAPTTASARSGSRGPALPKATGGATEETRHTFDAQLSDGRGPFLRTGDLGFLADGELFVTGRLKDLIIIRGVNYYPQDIEQSVDLAHQNVQKGAGAAFAVGDQGAERLVVVQEVERYRDLDFAGIIAAIRKRIAVGLRSGRVGRRAAQDRQHSQDLQRQDSAPRLPGWLPRRHAGGGCHVVARDRARWRSPSRFAAAIARRKRELDFDGMEAAADLAIGVRRRRIGFVPAQRRSAGGDRARSSSGPVNDHVEGGAADRAHRPTAPRLPKSSTPRSARSAASESASSTGTPTSSSWVSIRWSGWRSSPRWKKPLAAASPISVLPNMETCGEVVEAIQKHLGGELQDRTTKPQGHTKCRKRITCSQVARVPAAAGELQADRPTAGCPIRSSQCTRAITNDRTTIGGQEYINFCSYNYIGMSGDPHVIEATRDAVARYGTSVSASRLVSGEKPLHRKLERGIADFIGTEDAIVFVGGHSTNESVIGHLFGPGDLILHDALSHNSIMQGAILSGARRRPFPHNDWRDCEKILAEIRHEYRRVLIVVEGVYSMDGDYPDLPKFVEIKKRHKAYMMVDEAHSIGTMGLHGRGMSEHFGINPRDVDMWMGTLSKCFGSCGGYIAGQKELVEYLKYTAPGFVYSVGLSPPNAAAALASLELLQEEPERVARLAENSRLFLRLAKDAGLNTGTSNNTPVVPVITGNSEHALRLSHQLRSCAASTCSRSCTRRSRSEPPGCGSSSPALHTAEQIRCHGSRRGRGARPHRPLLPRRRPSAAGSGRNELPRDLRDRGACRRDSPISPRSRPAAHRGLFTAPCQAG